MDLEQIGRLMNETLGAQGFIDSKKAEINKIDAQINANTSLIAKQAERNKEIEKIISENEPKVAESKRLQSENKKLESEKKAKQEELGKVEKELEAKKETLKANGVDFTWGEKTPRVTRL